jgi:hypothetical protein
MYLKVESHAPTSRAHEKEELIAAWCVKRINDEVPFCTGCAAIKSTVLPSPHIAIVVDKVQGSSELTE